MAGKTAILEVDGQAYEVTALDTTDALELYDHLRLALGDVVGKALAGGGTPEQLEARLAAGAIGGLPKGTPQKLHGIFAPRTKARMRTEGSVAEVWVPITGDLAESWFANPQGGRGIGHWQRWMIACLKFQFADFLPASATSKNSSPAPADVAVTKK